ncbi:MAG: SIMPL domain-containing protein [Actinobacteria bacterium]|nr:SIMPL domain-containing protein [Actinomycetota bacterium]
MKHIALIALAGLGLAACTQGSSQPNITVNTGENRTGVSVSGTGEVTGTPDTLTIDLGVSVLADTVADATTQAAERADALIEALVSGGVEREDITTTNFSIFPEYDYRGQEERLTGYRVNNTVRAEIRDIAAAGDLIDQAVAAAEDTATVHGLSFSTEDDAELVEAARAAAWEDARAKAEQLASLSGQTLGRAIAITETMTSTPPPIPYFEESYAGDAALERATPIEPGSETVRIVLQVDFALEG